MRRANKVVVISQTMAQDLVERGVKREQIVCVPNGVDTGLFSPKPREQTLSQILQIDSLVIGFIGSLRRLEGLDILIYAFRRILSEFPQVKLLIVGEGEDRKRLERMSEELGVRQKIIFTGLIDHSLVPMYYSLIDIVVFPRVDSRVNRLVTPLKPLEAQAMGKALIISDLPALKETVSPEQSHFTFRPGDIEGLADLCIRLLRDDHLRHELGRANRKYVVENRDWTLIVKKYNELYRLMGLPNH
jgi:glycosyltransferase involved in cell wall biosynthesis